MPTFLRIAGVRFDDCSQGLLPKRLGRRLWDWHDVFSESAKNCLFETLRCIQGSDCDVSRELGARVSGCSFAFTELRRRVHRAWRDGGPSFPLVLGPENLYSPGSVKQL
jgi:hypothetical protein